MNERTYPEKDCPCGVTFTPIAPNQVYHAHDCEARPARPSKVAVAPLERHEEIAAAVFGHPVRLKILLMAISRDRVSASMVAKELGQPVPRLAYHMRRLASAGLLVLVGVEPRRGAVEHFYRPAPDASNALTQALKHLRAVAATLEEPRA